MHRLNLEWLLDVEFAHLALFLASDPHKLYIVLGSKHFGPVVCFAELAETCLLISVRLWNFKDGGS